MMVIALKINGVVYGGWENITIKKSMQSLTHEFEIEFKRGDVSIDNNSIISILKDGKNFLVGYIDDIDIDIADIEKPMKVAGRSKAMDLIDCNILVNQQYANLNAIQIIKDMIKEFSIKVNTNLSLEPLTNFNTEVGETYFNAINRLCKQLNILPLSDNNGDIRLIKNENNVQKIPLKEFLSLKFRTNFQNRFSEYTYKKETAIVDVTDGKINDESVKRYRPFVGINTEDKTNYDMANWKKNNDISNSIFLDGVVLGWDYDLNTIFKIETDIVNGFYLVNSIVFSKSDNGTLANIKFVDKDLFK